MYQSDANPCDVHRYSGGSAGIGGTRSTGASSVGYYLSVLHNVYGHVIVIYLYSTITQKHTQITLQIISLFSACWFFVVF